MMIGKLDLGARLRTGCPSHRGNFIAAAALLLAGLSLPIQSHARPAPLRPGDRYVAMGSSFAAGPGVTASADTPRNRCTRSQDNYPRQLARLRGLTLVDVSCSGATVANLLRPWSEIPAQLDALTADTRLVTVTIGGNDIGYIGRLMSTACHALAERPDGAAPATPPRCVGMQAAPTEQTWTKLAEEMGLFVAEVRRRAPLARLVFIPYPRVLPPQGSCDKAPLPADFAEQFRAAGIRLAALTKRVAKEGRADFLPLDRLSVGHDACATTPWTTGYAPFDMEKGIVPFHPNLAGMTAIAAALDRSLGR